MEGCRARSHVSARFSASPIASNFGDPKITSAREMVLVIEIPHRFGGEGAAVVRSLSNLCAWYWTCIYSVRRIATAVFHKELKKS